MNAKDGEDSEDGGDDEVHKQVEEQHSFSLVTKGAMRTNVLATTLGAVGVLPNGEFRIFLVDDASGNTSEVFTILIVVTTFGVLVNHLSSGDFGDGTGISVVL